MNEYKAGISESLKDPEQMFPTHSSYKQKLKNEKESQEYTENKDLLRPLSKSDAGKYKKEDLIKLHEFRRENIVEPFKELEDRDFFSFTSEDDPKYKFVNVQYMLRSKLLIKAIAWSFGIGCAFFLHRYYRKQMFWPALRWGGMTWSLSMLGIWGSLEFSPHLMAIFHSQFIKDLSMKDQSKYKNIGNLKQEELLNQSYFDQYGVRLKYSQNSNCEIAKVAYEYDSLTLVSNDYSPLQTDKIIKYRKFTEDDLFSEDFDEKELANQLDEQSEKDFDYDFSFHKETKLNDLCSVKTDKFFELEKKSKFNKKRIELLKNDVLSKPDAFDLNTMDLLRKEIISAENYLSGVYKKFESDPDFRFV
jgi:hypothetical protein